MAKIGYARVSTVKQDLSEQIAALEKFGCEKIFFGKFSGKAKDEDFNTILRRVAQSQIQLNNMLNYVREGDGATLIFSYDTMADCLKNEIGISRAIFNGEYRGWLIGVNKGNG